MMHRRVDLCLPEELDTDMPVLTASAQDPGRRMTRSESRSCEILSKPQWQRGARHSNLGTLLTKTCMFAPASQCSELGTSLSQCSVWGSGLLKGIFKRVICF